MDPRISNSGPGAQFYQPSTPSTTTGSYPQQSPSGQIPYQDVEPDAPVQQLPSYEDDEPIEVKPILPRVQEDSQARLELSARCGIVPVKVSQTAAQEVPCMISLKGRNRNVEELERERPGADIICVIDTSSSMQGAKIALAEETLKFLVENATAQDRISLVAFNEKVMRLCPLTICTPPGKETLIAHIRTLRANGSTRISGGLRAGLKVLRDRRIVNVVSSLFLLSDGRDTCERNAGEHCQDILETEVSEIVGGLSVHTFGFGADHDPQLMNSLAENGHGVFQYVEQLDSISAAFATSFSGLISQVAKNIEVRLTENPGPVPCIVSRLFVRNGKDYFTVSMVMANESKELIFLLAVPILVLPEPVTFSVVTAHVKYVTTQGLEVTEDLSVDVQFVPEDSTSSIEKNSEVFVNLYRVKAAEVLAQAQLLAERMQFTEAQNLLRDGLVELETCEIASHPLIAQLIDDFKRSIESTRDRANYYSGGSAHLQSISSNHYYQTASLQTPSYATCQQGYYVSRTIPSARPRDINPQPATMPARNPPEDRDDDKTD